jgi:hypothetical protein
MNFTASQLDRVIKLATQCITDGKNSRLRLKADTSSKSIRCIMYLILHAFIFIPGAITKHVHVGILFQYIPVL